MNIFIGSDHAGFELKKFLVDSLGSFGHTVIDCGAEVFDSTDDYPLYISRVARAVSEAESINVSNDESPVYYADSLGISLDYGDMGMKKPSYRNTVGIVIGGSGQGEAIVANRFKHIRAIVCYGGNMADDIITLSREHNDSNVLSLGARFLSHDQALSLIISWLSTDFSGDARHVRRIHEIEEINQDKQLYE
jgi:ribose 5-phosphate isomerase B